jgi:hypothetical protein
MLAAHMAAPREGHLRATFQVFAYLKLKHNARRIYHPTFPRIDTTKFRENESWTSFYGEVKEAIPTNAPIPTGKSVVMPLFVDADHDGNMLTRRSITVYVQLINNAVVNQRNKDPLRVQHLEASLWH